MDPETPKLDSEALKSDFLIKIEAISKTIGFIAVGIGALGAMLQYFINSQAESRQRYVAELQGDIQISTLFSELVQTANGYDKYSDPQPEAIKAILSIVPNNVVQQILMSDPRNFSKLLTGSRITSPVPLGRQLSAAESIANLAIKYPILLEPALTGLDVVAGFMPAAKDPYVRLIKHYGLNRPLTRWTKDWARSQDNEDQKSEEAPKTRE